MNNTTSTATVTVGTDGYTTVELKAHGRFIAGAAMVAQFAGLSKHELCKRISGAYDGTDSRARFYSYWRQFAFTSLQVIAADICADDAARLTDSLTAARADLVAFDLAVADDIEREAGITAPKSSNYTVVHYKVDSCNGRGESTYSACGATWSKRGRAPFTTLDVDAITCKRCLRAPGIADERATNAARREASAQPAIADGFIVR